MIFLGSLALMFFGGLAFLCVRRIVAAWRDVTRTLP